jgi:hypothetical protein
MATPKQVRDAAQNALHTVWTQGDHDKATKIYGGLRTWVQYGSTSSIHDGQSQKYINQARLLIGSLPANLQAPLNAYLAFDPKKLKDAKADGFIAPPQEAAKNVGPIEKQLPKDIKAGVNALDVAGVLSTLLDPDTWLRVAEVVLGGALIVVGLIKLTNVASLVGSATPAGRIVRALK